MPLALACALILGWLPGCNGPESSRRAPQDEPASPPGARESERPAEPAPPAAPPRDQEPEIPLDPIVELERLEAMVRLWVEHLGAGRSREALAGLISMDDMEVTIKPAIRGILAGNLYGSNHANVVSILEKARGKEVRIETWKPTGVHLTGTTTIYERRVPMMSGARLSLSVGGERLDLRIDFLAPMGDWKIFKLDLPPEGEEEG